MLKNIVNKKFMSFYFYSFWIIISSFYLFSACKTGEEQDNTKTPHLYAESVPSEKAKTTKNIRELTAEDVVIRFVKQNHHLPDYYLTKSEAKKQGWIPSQDNLCDVLPGRAIGGDVFGNREKILPEGDKYFEADVNYNCGQRTADRIIFNAKGEVWTTHNHYKTFQKQ